MDMSVKISSSIVWDGKLLSFDKPKIMGILNFNGDSFYTGSRSHTLLELENKCEQMIKDQADIIDIGIVSSRPGASLMDPLEEAKILKSILPTIKNMLSNGWFSIDTTSALVAQIAIDNGFSIVNDISGGHKDQKMLPFIGKECIPYIAMHMRGNPENMQELNQYEDIVGEILAYFIDIVRILPSDSKKNLMLDPGFGFSKDIPQNFHLLNSLEYFQLLNFPLVVGLSRKSFIWKSIGVSSDEALNGTTALNMVALMKGASILRVHDVKEAREVVDLYKNFKIND